MGQLSVRIPDDNHEQIRDLAGSTGLSQARVLQVVIMRGLKDVNKKALLETLLEDK